MAEKYICIRCKKADFKTHIPYKIIEDKDGMSVKFKGQLCEDCFKKLFESSDGSAAV
jgi:hypothetical protein